MRSRTESRPEWNSARVMCSGLGGPLRPMYFLAMAARPVIRATRMPAVAVTEVWENIGIGFFLQKETKGTKGDYETIDHGPAQTEDRGQPRRLSGYRTEDGVSVFRWPMAN